MEVPMRRIITWLLAGSVSLLVAPAQATPDYPEVLDEALMVSCARPNSRCLVCHTSSRGGQGTAMQPFARDLVLNYFEVMNGVLRGGDPAGLRAALVALDDMNDADGDGEFDKVELAECGNPSGEDLGIGPEYGCDGAHLAVVPRSSPLPGLLALLALSWLRARSRQRRITSDPGHR
jgi:hypothetical protein